MTLGATLTATLATQQMELTREAFAPGASEGAKAVSELVDRVDSRLGSGAVRRPRLVESPVRSEEPTSALQSLMRISCAVFCLQKTKLNTGRPHVCHTLTHA